MITLVLGGARSGKSEVAERVLARHGDRLVYVATATATDPDMAARIERHRSRRDARWTTVEPGADEPAVLDALQSIPEPLLLESLGTWVAGTPSMSIDGDALIAALRSREHPTVVVSEEVGLGVHPPSEAGRRFRDVLGDLNQAVAQIADEVLLVVAGRVLELGPGEPPGDDDA